MNLFRILFILSSLSLFVGRAQTPEESVSKYSNHGEVYFKIRPAGNEEPVPLPCWISVDAPAGDGWMKAYALQDKLTPWLSNNGTWTVEVLQHPSTLISPVMKDVQEIKETNDWDFYPTYEAYLEMMYDFQDSYPGLCKVMSFGETNEGRHLLAAVITGGNAGDGEKPQVLYTSSIHGDETTGYILFLRLIDHLLTHYDNDAMIKDLVDNVEIWINPLANPDGTYASGNNTVSGATRVNANGVDLNRNYPDPEDGPHPDGNDWQIETQHFMNLAGEQNFVLGVNSHGGAEVFNYPWDTWPQLPADDDWWNFVGREWVDTVHIFCPPGYFDGFDDGVSNGYQWYSINGGRQDYMNYFHHCREFTLEISDTKLLPADQLPDFWEYNYRSFINYIRQARYGIRGRITDAASGDPIEAFVVIDDHDAENSWVVSNAEGWFYRPIYGGTYSVSFFSPGYESYQAQSVQVDNYSSITLEIKLNYTGSGVEDVLLADLFTIVNNPGPGPFRIDYHGTSPLPVSIRTFDTSGREVQFTHWNCTSENRTCHIDLGHMDPGLYILQLSSGEKEGRFKVILQK